MSKRNEYKNLPLVPFVDSDDEIFFGPVTAYERRKREINDQLKKNLPQPEFIRLSSSSSEDESDPEVYSTHRMHKSSHDKQEASINLSESNSSEEVDEATYQSDPEVYLRPRMRKSSHYKQEASIKLSETSSPEEVDEATNRTNVYSDISSTAFDFDESFEDHKNKSSTSFNQPTSGFMNKHESDSETSFISAEEEFVVDSSFKVFTSTTRKRNGRSESPMKNKSSSSKIKIIKAVDYFGTEDSTLGESVNVQFDEDSSFKVFSPTTKKRNGRSESPMKNKSSSSKIKIIKAVDYFGTEDSILEESVNEQFDEDSSFKVFSPTTKKRNGRSESPMKNKSSSSSKIKIIQAVDYFGTEDSTLEESVNEQFDEDSSFKVFSPTIRKRNGRSENSMKNTPSSSKIKIIQAVDYFGTEESILGESVNKSRIHDTSLGLCSYLDKSSVCDKTFEQDKNKILKNLSVLTVNDSTESNSSIASENVNESNSSEFVSLKTANNLNDTESKITNEESNFFDLNSSMYVNVSLSQDGETINDLTCNIKSNSTLHSFDGDNSSFASSFSYSPHNCKINKVIILKQQDDKNHTSSQEVEVDNQNKKIDNDFNIKQSLSNKSNCRSNILPKVQCFEDQHQGLNIVSNIVEPMSNKSFVIGHSNIRPEDGLLNDKIEECQGLNVSNITGVVSNKSTVLDQRGIFSDDAIEECQGLNNVSNIAGTVSNKSIVLGQSNILSDDEMEECQGLNNVSNIAGTVSNKSTVLGQSNILSDDEMEEYQGLNNVSNIAGTVSNKSIVLGQSNILSDDEMEECQGLNNVSNIAGTVSNKSIVLGQSNILSDDEMGEYQGLNNVSNITGVVSNKSSDQSSIFSDDEIEECQGLNNVSSIAGTMSNKRIVLAQSNILSDDEIEECQGLNNVSSIAGTMSIKRIVLAQSNILSDDEIEECQGENNVSNIAGSMLNKSIVLGQSNILSNDEIEEYQGLNNVSYNTGAMSNKSTVLGQSNILSDDAIEECQRENNVSYNAGSMLNKSIVLGQSNILSNDEIEECQGENIVSNIAGAMSNKSIVLGQSNILSDDEIEEYQGQNNVSNIGGSMSNKSTVLGQSNILSDDAIEECQGENNVSYNAGSMLNKSTVLGQSNILSDDAIEEYQGQNNVSNIAGAMSNKSIVLGQSDILSDDEIEECQGENNVSNIGGSMSNKSSVLGQSNILSDDAIEECQGENNVSNIGGSMSNKSTVLGQSNILSDDAIEECQGENNVSYNAGSMLNKSTVLGQSNILSDDAIEEYQGQNNVSNIAGAMSNKSIVLGQSDILSDDEIEECQGGNNVSNIGGSMSNKSSVLGQNSTLCDEIIGEFENHKFSSALQSQTSSFKSAKDEVMEQKYENYFEEDNYEFVFSKNPEVGYSPGCSGSFVSSLHLSAVDNSIYSFSQENSNAGQAGIQLRSDLFDETINQGCFKSIDFTQRYTTVPLKTIAPEVLKDISSDTNTIETLKGNTNLCAVKRSSSRISQESKQSDFVSAVQSQESSFKSTCEQMDAGCEDQPMVSSGLNESYNSPACKKKCSIPCCSVPEPSLICTAMEKNNGESNLKLFECKTTALKCNPTILKDVNNSTEEKCDIDVIDSEIMSQESKQSSFISALESHESSFKSTCTNTGTINNHPLNVAGINNSESSVDSPLKKESYTHFPGADFIEPMEISYSDQNCFKNYRDVATMNTSLIADVTFDEPSVLDKLDKTSPTISSKLTLNKTDKEFKTKSLLRPPKFHLKPTGILAKAKLNDDWKQTSSKKKERDTELPSLKKCLTTPTATKSKIPRLPSSSKQQFFTPRSETAVSTASAKKQNSLYKNVKSPIRTYIQTASPVLVTQVKSTEKDRGLKLKKTGTSEKKKSNALQRLNYNTATNEETENVDPNLSRPSLLPVIYKSAPNVFLKDNQDVQKKLPKLNAKLKKLLDTPRPKVIKHEGRTNIPPSEPGSLFINTQQTCTSDAVSNDLPMPLENQNNISICATKTLYKSNALSK